jgi:hypothetical protein
MCPKSTQESHNKPLHVTQRAQQNTTICCASNLMSWQVWRGENETSKQTTTHHCMRHFLIKKEIFDK